MDFGLDGWDEKVFPDDAISPDMLLGELSMMFFEWMHAHKVTDECAKSAYRLLHTLLPAGANAGSWNTASKMLQAVYDRSVIAIEMCPNDCIAFYDCKHPKVLPVMKLSAPITTSFPHLKCVARWQATSTPTVPGAQDVAPTA